MLSQSSYQPQLYNIVEWLSKKDQFCEIPFILTYFSLLSTTYDKPTICVKYAKQEKNRDWDSWKERINRLPIAHQEGLALVILDGREPKWSTESQNDKAIVRRDQSITIPVERPLYYIDMIYWELQKQAPP